MQLPLLPSLLPLVLLLLLLGDDFVVIARCRQHLCLLCHVPRHHFVV
jgi:hypothetical protein